MRRLLLVVILVLGTAPAIARAQSTPTSALISRALASRMTLTLNGTLPDAIKAIADKTGVPIEAGPEVYDALPWGEETTFKAKIENGTLDQALDAITRTLGLVYTIGPEAIELEPMPALRRLGRRATLDELHALDVLRSTKVDLKPGYYPVHDLLTAVDSKLEATKSAFAVENRAFPEDQATKVDLPRDATLAQTLDAVARDTHATWYPWGQSILVVRKVDQIRHQLRKKISARYNGVEVGQVLQELAERSGVLFNYSPGALQNVPASYRTIKLFIDNASIEQALQSISGVTGLSFAITDDGVHVSYGTDNAGAATQPATQPAR